MPEILGPMSVVQRALPTGVDGTKLAEWQMREGTSFGAFINQLGAAVGSVNQELAQRWGYLFGLSEDMMVEYPDGGSVTELGEITDMSERDPVLGTTIGHMIDLKAYGGAVGGSKRYFRDARMAQINSTIATIVNQAKWRFEKRIFTRLMTDTENAIGSAGYDVPFIKGGGSVAYTPPAYSGKTFASSHSHFLALNSGASKTFANVFNDLAETLAEHGHSAPFIAHVSVADVETIAALSKFVQFVAPVITTIDRGGETSGNQLYASGQPMVFGGTIGYYQSKHGLIELRANNRIPTGYVNMIKSYGQLDPRNPLWVRVHPQVGFGLVVVPETTSDSQYPVKKVSLEFEFGVGIGQDRTNGANCYLAAGTTWSNPTIG
ncbi:MAG: hypothetical protein E6R03_17550 [Hyphomicrobiaceae bacterium]|nr:MAG: hypothetical protein E6R03_17550 [Hyphomicrobiaceae bacterium]